MANDYLLQTTGKSYINNKRGSTGQITNGEAKISGLAKSFVRNQKVLNNIASNQYTIAQWVDTSNPNIVQNDYSFPEVASRDPISGLYDYSYYMDYSNIKLDSDLELVRKTANIPLDSKRDAILKNTSMFNRFKIPTIGDAFTRGFGHLFFTRPSCNILTYDGTSYKLASTVENDNVFIQGYRNHLDILKQLCGHTEYHHDFLMYLTNKATGFSVEDKRLDTDNYGRNIVGHTVQYGRHCEKSKVAGTVSVPYMADRDMLIYHLHNYWIQYIAKVYRGKIKPLNTTILDKIIDYASSAYYFVTAEDFETIIYWIKLYGIFPSNTPDEVFSWTSGSPIKDINPSISYAYSWRSDDCDPKVLYDFNFNATYGNNSDFKYIRNYQPNWANIGETWVQAPFIEFVKNSSGSMIPKLRWRSPDL